MDVTHQTRAQEEYDQSKTVLIIEDEYDIAEALTALLQEETPYQVLHVGDGFAALTLVETMTPHLIVLDYRLPGMDGLACLEALRATKGLEDTPVIFMSAQVPRQMKGDLGVTKLEKPFEVEHFLRLVQQFLEG